MDEYVTRESKSEKSDEKGVLQTLSKQVTGPIRVVIQWNIEKFASMMSSYDPGDSIWSEGVASKREKGAVWQLRLYPNGNNGLNRGTVSLFLHLTGPMADREETLRASYHIYLDGGFCRAKLSVALATITFEPGMLYNRGGTIDDHRVRSALRKDGSLVVVAEVKFPVPRRR